MSESTDFTERNYGYISRQQQAQLKDTVVAVAGLGGVGGAVAVQLARLGVGTLRLADPDTFDRTNINRQEGATESTIGQNKAEVVARLCQGINPDIRVSVFTEGVLTATAQQFVSGANLVVEATDYTVPHIGVALARAARQADCPLIMGIELGFGTIVTSFVPRGYSYERYLGLTDTVELSHLESGNKPVPLHRLLPALPRYGDVRVLRAVSDGTMSAPAIAPAVAITAGTMAAQSIAHLLGTDRPVIAPRVLWFDALQGKSQIIRYRRMRQSLHYIRLAWRHRRGKNIRILGDE